MIKALGELSIIERSQPIGRVESVKRNFASRANPQPSREVPRDLIDTVTVGREPQPVRPAGLREPTYSRPIAKLANDSAIVAKFNPIDKDVASKPIFQTGVEINGAVGDGWFMFSHAGLKGTFHELPSGEISFQIGDFKGIYTHGTAMAYNPNTGEAFSMKVKGVSASSFTVYDVKQIN